MSSNVPDPQSALRLSIAVGVWCAVLGAPLAITIGYWLARKEFFGKSIIGTLLFAPMVLPPVVVGLMLLRVFSIRGPIGRFLSEWGIEIPFTFLGATLAAFVVSLPLYIMSVRGAFESIDSRYEEVSATLGRRPWHTFFRITLPLALPGVTAGALLTFARALGEFGATAILAGNAEGRTRTLSLAIYSLMESPGGESRINQLLLFSLALSFTALLLYDGLNRWQKRRMGRVK